VEARTPETKIIYGMAKQREVLEKEIIDNCRRQHPLAFWMFVLRACVVSVNCWKFSASEVWIGTSAQKCRSSVAT
jgi:hypothetical protein